eukprot:652109-Alexandrium_andersonii.AAC.1
MFIQVDRSRRQVLVGAGLSEGKITYPDLAVVPENCTGGVAAALWEGRLRSIGLETWQDKLAPSSEQAATRETKLEALEGHNVVHLSVYMGSTDQGPDQAATYK